MQQTITMRRPAAASDRETRLRRSATITALLALGIIAAVALGLWLALAFALPEALYASIALAAALSDPLRTHLHQIL